jgi:hypothetical protein
VVSVVVPGSEESLAKATSQAKSARNSSPVKSLIRRGFFGLRVTPSAPTSAALSALPRVKRTASTPEGATALGRSLSQTVVSTPAVSKSQLGYFRRVKEKVAKQLSKNKELLAETIFASLGEGVEGYPEEVHKVLGVASMVGMTWGGVTIRC